MPPPMPGMMPGMPQGMPPGMPGQPPMGGDPGMPPNPAMGALEQLSGMPMQAKTQKAMAEASANLQIALADVYGRSAKASDLLSKAYSDIQKARQVLDELSSAPMAPPPNLLGGMSPMPMGGASPMM